MKRNLFKKTLEWRYLFSTRDVYRLFPSFDKRRLSEWKNSWKIIPIKRGWWLFSWYPQNIPFLRKSANLIYTPSYISLQSALKRYWLIPETVVVHLSMSTKKTALVSSKVWTFSYSSIKSDLFFWYTIITDLWISFLIAEPEKALCDLFYTDITLRDNDSFEELRIEPYVFYEYIDEKKLINYAEKYPSTVLTAIKKFLLFMKNSVW